jgi:hypothetical protein
MHLHSPPHRHYVSEGCQTMTRTSGRKERLAPGTTRDSNEHETEEETPIHVYGISRDKVNRQKEKTDTMSRP